MIEGVGMKSSMPPTKIPFLVVFVTLWCENLLRIPFFSYSLFGVEVLIRNYVRVYDWPVTMASWVDTCLICSAEGEEEMTEKFQRLTRGGTAQAVVWPSYAVSVAAGVSSAFFSAVSDPSVSLATFSAETGTGSILSSSAFRFSAVLSSSLASPFSASLAWPFESPFFASPKIKKQDLWIFSSLNHLKLACLS